MDRSKEFQVVIDNAYTKRQFIKKTQEDFEEAYDKHQAWLSGSQDGIQIDWVGVDLSDISFPAEANLEKIRIKDSNLYGAELEGVKLLDANLSGTNLSGANLSGANLISVDFREANLVRTNFAEADLRLALLGLADLAGANLEKADLEKAFLVQANLENANLSNTNLERANFEKARLVDGILVRANLFNATLIGANLEGAKLIGADIIEANLYGANLEGANLEKADLSHSVLENIRLSETILKEANLEGVNFSNSDLRSSDFRGANFSGSDLRNSDLRNSDLRGADLTRANLEGANMEGANMEGANLDMTYHDAILSWSSREIRNNFTIEIEKLQQERLKLLRDKNASEFEIEKNKKQIEILIKEIEEKTKSGQILTRINSIFLKLDQDITADIKEEATRLKRMFGGYYIFTAIFLGALIAVWLRFYCVLDDYIVDSQLKMDMFTFWINISPSVLLISLMVLCIYQAHKCQRQLLSLREFLYNHQLIRGNLSSIISINGEENIAKSVEKVSAMFEGWASSLIKSNINIGDIESVKNDIEKKDVAINEKTIDLIKELIKKI